MRLLYRYDLTTGLFIEPVEYTDTFTVDPQLGTPDPQPEDLVDIMPVGLYTPKWDGTAWVEGVDSGVLLTNGKVMTGMMLKEAMAAANEAPIDYMNHIFQMDPVSKGILAQTLSIGSVPSGFYWQDIDNVQVPMTTKELKGFGLTLLTRTQANFTNYQRLKLAITAAVSVDEINLITIDGWV